MPVWNPTITQKVRQALLEDGHSDLVVEQLAGHFREIETRIERLERDVKLLQDAERERLTESGVFRIVESRFNKGAVDWMKVAVRAGLIGACGLVLKFAWKGLST